MGVLLGFDPGGRKTFGWCIVEDAEEPPLKVVGGGDVDNAREAIEAVYERLPRQAEVLPPGSTHRSSGPLRTDALIAFSETR